MNEVLRIKKELEKTIPNNDTKRALELLRSLESVPMTLDLLQTTHIGKTVNKIRKAVDNNEVISMSKSMVKKWKKLLSSSSSSSSNNNNSSITNLSTNNSNTTTTSNANYNTSSNESNSASATINSKGGGGAAPDQDYHSHQITHNQSQSGHQKDQVSSVTQSERVKKSAPVQTEVPVTTSEVRLKCRQLLAEALKKPLPGELISEPFLEEDILAGRIEECIFQEFRGTDAKYKNRVRSRVSNLSDSKNPYLRFNVLRGDLAPERIAKMTAEEMASDELKREREKFTKEAINDHQMTLTSGTKTSEIKCPACKKFNVTYNQVQTRSADEPMTTFCYCNECGKRWKFC